jgi:hypothetical protein
MRLRVILSVMLAILALSVACTESQSEKQREAAIDTRADTFARAEAAHPVPHTTNFPLRAAVVKMTERQDLANHPWYIYLYGDQGNVLGYYVAQTVPISTCAFLSSTENVRTSSNGNLVLTAPSLDGIYYGGAGASGGCGWFFFDYATDALIQLGPNEHYRTSDRVLLLDAEEIKLQTEP